MDFNDLCKSLKDSLDGEYNILVHGIDKPNKDFTTVAKNINREGLKYQYITLYRTVRDFGKVKDLTPEQLKYIYGIDDNNLSTNILLAVPDYFLLDNSILPIYPQDKFKVDKSIDDGGFRSFFDVVVNFSKTNEHIIPPQFIYGYYTINNSNGQLSFVQNNQHFTNLDYEQKRDFEEKWKERIIDCGFQFLTELGREGQEIRIDTAKLVCDLMKDKWILRETADSIVQTRKTLQKEAVQ